MPSELTAMPAAPSAQGLAKKASAFADYWALTKPDVNLLILVTTAAGFFLALPTHLAGFPIILLVHTLAATLLVASGTATLNQYVERRFDAQMRRTKRRPVAAGRIEASQALLFGIALSVSGAIYLTVAVNLLASLLAVLTLLSYLLIYTPLKRESPLCTLIGALPGAAPPLIGWAAATGMLSMGAWVLYGLVFLWQFPHFMAIAWMYRGDYERAGYLVLPHGRRRDSVMGLQAVLPSLGLIALSFATVLLGKHGLIYAAGAMMFSSCFLYYGAQLVISKTNDAARRLLFASILYLPAMFVVMMMDRI